MTILKETQDYILTVGPNPYDSNKAIEYLIHNKTTKVLEVDTRIEAHARKMLRELQTFLDAIREVEETEVGFEDEGISIAVPDVIPFRKH